MRDVRFETLYCMFVRAFCILFSFVRVTFRLYGRHRHLYGTMVTVISIPTVFQQYSSICASCILAYIVHAQPQGMSHARCNYVQRPHIPRQRVTKSQVFEPKVAAHRLKKREGENRMRSESQVGRPPASNTTIATRVHSPWASSGPPGCHTQTLLTPSGKLGACVGEWTSR